MSQPSQPEKARYQQPFSNGQAHPFLTGPFLGGYLVAVAGAVGAGGTVTFNHPLRVKPRHVEVVGTALGDYPSRVCFVAGTTFAAAVVKFESAQAAGSTLWIW